MGKSSSAPAAPDPYAVAGAQQGLNTSTARLNAQLNRPNISTPFGTQTWTQGAPQYNEGAYQSALAAYNAPTSGGSGFRTLGSSNRGQAPTRDSFMIPGSGSDQWTSTMTLDPRLQGAVDSSMGNVQNALSTPFSLNDTMDQLNSILEPQLQRDEDALNTRLINSGFRQGSQGFDQAQQDFAVNKQKARSATAGQAVNIAAALRNQPLQELNSLKSGTNPMNPGANVGINPSDITGPFSQQYQGQLAGYNADVGSQNAKLGAGTSLAAAYMLSDRRLKSEIKRVGTHKLGIGIYEYRIHGQKQIGVMADEVEKVMPSAVKEINGYKAVDYAQLA